MNFFNRISLLISLICCCKFSLAASTYYIHPSGNNASSGLSISAAWRSIAKINATTFFPGDTILFEGGSTFKGNIYLGPGNAGIRLNPIVISSYGTGKAIIGAGNSDGFYAYNTAGIEVRNLVFSGSGYTVNTGVGIHFFMDKTGNNKLKHIVLENIEVSGFRTAGIQVSSSPTDQSRSGYDSVTIRNCIIHDNGHSGINVSGYYKTTDTFYSHRHFRISRCIVYNNTGISGWSGHSGSGIVVGQTDSCIIEYCEAYENGKNNDYAIAGPAGIWAWDSKHVIIQHCYAHHNRSQTTDGGGFDFDGGVQNSMMQNNYAHDNDGPGFMIAQYTGARKMKNIVLRYNISEHDGRGLGVLVWSGDPAGNVTAEKIDIYNNTIYADTAGNAFVNAAIAVNNNYGAMKDIRVCNNIFLTRNNVAFIDISPNLNLKFYNNTYYDNGEGFKFIDKGTTYTSMVIWRSSTGQEVYNGKNSGSRTNPLILNAGKGGSVAGVDSLKALKAYRLHNTSVTIGLGIIIDSLLRFESILTDFFDDTIYTNDQYSPGAHEIDAPEAQFSISNTCVGIVSKFVNRSLKSTGYFWKFDDGTTSTLHSPTNLFSNPGIHSTTLIVSGKFGYIDSIKRTFEIYANPIPNFMISGGNTCPKTGVLFSNLSSNAVSFLWRFDDSTTDISQHATHAFKYPGTHKVKLVVTSAKTCKDSITRQVEIHPNPSAAFSVTKPCLRDSVLFKGAGNNDSLHHWDFGDSSFSTLMAPEHLYQYPGNRFVTHIAISTHKCRDTFDKQVEIHKNPIAGFKADDHCFGSAVPLQNLSVNDSVSSWDFGNGVTSDIREPLIICKFSGNIKVKLKVMSNKGCSDTTEMPVKVFELPSAQFTHLQKGDSFYFKAKDTLLKSYRWYVNNNLLLHTQPQVSVKFSGKGIQKVLLKTENTNNCTDTFSRFIDNSSSVDIIKTANRLTAYPNPFSGNLTIQFKLNEPDITNMSITDMQGREIYTFTIPESTMGIYTFDIDITQYPLANGLYNLVFSTGNNTVVKKLVKE